MEIKTGYIYHIKDAFFEKIIEFYHNVGLDYVSCSPFRVPVAPLAASKVEIRERKINNK